MTIYIRDDLGHAWYFRDGKIRCVLSDLELGEENGYDCNSFEDGIKFLNENGYISGIEYGDYYTEGMNYFLKDKE